MEAHVTPGTRETWALHTASGFYIGNAWEHYRCHEIDISDTKHMQSCLTVFFKHKYLTIPTITPADTLICTADSLTDAIAEPIPAVDQLMVIFKQQARAANSAATAQRVFRECAQAERVIKEERQTIKAPASKTPTSFLASRCIQAGAPPSRCIQVGTGKATASSSFELEEPNDIPTLPQGHPQITQDEFDNYNAPPAANTQQQ